MCDSPPDQLPQPVREAYAVGADAVVRPIPIGLINRTYDVTSGGRRFVLQKLHPVFAPELNLDIEAITRHLVRRGVPTPELLRTVDDRAWVVEAGATWRALTFLPGRVIERVSSPSQADATGAWVARFHRALSDLEHDFHFTRAGVHDTTAHLSRLRDALATHRDHRLYDEIEPVATRILARGNDLADFSSLPLRIIHGDLKISNVLFDDSLTSVRALLDLDTLQRETMAVELGDAMRSWCNPGGEADGDAQVDVEVFRAALSGYASEGRDLLTPAEVAAIVPGFATIPLELAARFSTDALLESYFGWDEQQYASAGDHNLVRARNQLALSESVHAVSDALIEIARDAFEGR